MKKFSIIFFIILFSLLFGSKVFATTIISPLLEIETDPGESQKGVVKIFNETDKNLSLISSVEAFRAGDETGQPVYIPPSEQNAFLNWFKVEQDSIILKPNQVAIIPFELNVPSDAIPGGYYAVLFWQAVPDNVTDLAVSVGSKVGTLIFLKVKGDILENGEIVEFSTSEKRKLFFNLPLNFITRFQNNGNIHLQPSGTIELKNFVGQTEVLEINSASRYVLPDSIRRFDTVWGQESTGNGVGQKFIASLKNEINYLAWGRYTATLNLSYGIDEVHDVTNQLSFWFIPWRLLLIIFLIIIMLIFFVRLNSKINKLKRRVNTKQQIKNQDEDDE